MGSFQLLLVDCKSASIKQKNELKVVTAKVITTYLS